MKKQFPKFVSGFRDRHGKLRSRYRQKGRKTYYFQAKPWSDEWWAEYQACKTGKKAQPIAPGAGRTKYGSLEHVIQLYYSSPDFARLRPLTKKTYRHNIEPLRARLGDLPISTLRPKNVRRLMEEKADTPTQANKILKMLRLLCRVALQSEMIDVDPTMTVKPLKITGDGYHSWTDAEIEVFEKRFPPGTKEHLAFALLLYTAQRRSDVIKMGWQHLKEGSISIRQEKTEADVSMPLHPRLSDLLAATPKSNMTFLTTEYGRPFTSNGFGNWFKKACNRAGLPHCSAHGLRKSAARRLAEAGATAHQIMAITGHRSVGEVTRYTRAAEQKRLAAQAIDLLSSAEQRSEMANPDDKVSQMLHHGTELKGKNDG